MPRAKPDTRPSTRVGRAAPTPEDGGGTGRDPVADHLGVVGLDRHRDPLVVLPDLTKLRPVPLPAGGVPGDVPEPAARGVTENTKGLHSEGDNIAVGGNVVLPLCF